MAIHRGKQYLTVNILILVLLLSRHDVTGLNSDEFDKKPVKVDFDNVIENIKPCAKKLKQNSLKIAVAAMISPDYTYNSYIDLLRSIGKSMGKEVTFVQKKTYGEVNTMLKKKELDLAFVCSGPYVQGKKEFGLEIIAVPVCHGKKVYYSYFIVSKGSGITSLKGLRGKIFAFTDPMSNTGFMVPSYFLAKQSETAERFFKKTFFSYSHDNSIRAVANGIADGAAVDSLIFDYIKAKDPELFKNIIIIEKSPPYGIPPIVVHPSMDMDMKIRLKKIFFNIHKTNEGRRLLNNLQIDRFIQGNDTDYASVRALQKYLNTREGRKTSK